MKKLSAHFRAARIRASFNQKKLSDISGVMQCSISRFELGKQNITLETMVKLAKSLKSDELNNEIVEYIKAELQW